MLDPENRAYLEKVLTEPGPWNRAVVTDDGEFAILYSGDDPPRRRRLSKYGKQILKEGSTFILVGYESLLEPEE